LLAPTEKTTEEHAARFGKGLVDAHQQLVCAPMEFLFIVVIVAFWFSIGVVFLWIGSRVVTRVVLDEIAKDRKRRGG
jgi:hypothetical protein